MVAHEAEKIFTGTDWLNDHAILVDDNKITAVIHKDSIPENILVHKHYLLAPAFIDLQIYGAGGRLFATYPVESSLEKLHQYCVSGGAKYFLPTIATNHPDVVIKSIDAVREYQSQNNEGVIGLHLEGPWINKIKRGAHVEEYIHSPDIDEVKTILQYGWGIIKMITLAPEVCSTEVANLIKSENIILSAGHSNATYREGVDAFNNQYKTATHLFNAMSPLHHREPGLPAAIMNHPAVMASIIPDGYHVDFEMIRIAKRLMNDRLFIITDAVTDTDTGPYQHRYSDNKYECNGVLSGSSLTMAKGVKNLVDKVGVELGEALRMASLYPAKLMGMDKKLGKIEEGYEPSIVSLTEDVEVCSLL